MRRPALAAAAVNPLQAQVTHVKSVPAPVGGWNARDPLAKMAPIDAVTLENWFPRVSDCAIRGGEADHATGFAARPKTLAVYSPPTGSNKMFAATNGGVFDVTSAGAIGASVAARTEGYHVWLQMGVSGAHYLLMFNGVDKPLYYNGTSWIAVDGVSAPAITGVTTMNLISANVYKRRLFLIEKQKLSFWYLAADAVGGAATEFLLGPLCSKGGFLMAMGTWSFDSGAGPDDFAVFITSEGELIIFTGTNPGDATNWSLVGVYNIEAKPLGRRCFAKWGGDLILITDRGALPVSKLLQQKTSIDYASALSNKIENAFVEAARSYGANEGWEGVILPSQSAFIFNIPVAANTTYHQYVMNTVTKSWCKFSAWDASCFVVFNKELYFADADRVAKAWIGHSDDGANIVADAKTAFNYFGDNKQAKRWGLMRPQLLTDGALSFSLGLAVDFQVNAPLDTATYSVAAGATWDVSLWDNANWAAGLEIKQSWLTPQARVGYCAAGLLRIATNSLEVQWVSTDYTYETGGVIG
jgi:hypothetical protein